MLNVAVSGLASVRRMSRISRCPLNYHRQSQNLALALRQPRPQLRHWKTLPRIQNLLRRQQAHLPQSAVKGSANERMRIRSSAACPLATSAKQPPWLKPSAQPLANAQKRKLRQRLKNNPRSPSLLNWKSAESQGVPDIWHSL